jgi:hypothetical protein
MTIDRGLAGSRLASRDHGLPQRGSRGRRPARHRQRPRQQSVRKRQRDRGVTDVPQPGDPAGPDDPPAGHREQRAGQQHQPEREQADPAGTADRKADMVRHEPQQCRGPQHPAQPGADTDVRRGDPADRGQRREHGEAGGGGRAGGDASRDDERPGGLRPGRGPRALLRPGVFRVGNRRCFGGNTHKPILATIARRP